MEWGFPGQQAFFQVDDAPHDRGEQRVMVACSQALTLASLK